MGIALHCCEKNQWPMHIEAVILEKERLVLKEGLLTVTLSLEDPLEPVFLQGILSAER